MCVCACKKEFDGLRGGGYEGIVVDFFFFLCLLLPVTDLACCGVPGAGKHWEHEMELRLSTGPKKSNSNIVLKKIRHLNTFKYLLQNIHVYIGILFTEIVQWTKSIYNSKNVFTLRNLYRMHYLPFLSISPLHMCTIVLVHRYAISNILYWLSGTRSVQLRGSLTSNAV